MKPGAQENLVRLGQLRREPPVALEIGGLLRRAEAYLTDAARSGLKSDLGCPVRRGALRPRVAAPALPCRAWRRHNALGKRHERAGGQNRIAERDERLELLERLWDSLSEMPADVPVTQAQRTELDRRSEALDQDASRGAPWACPGMRW